MNDFLNQNSSRVNPTDHGAKYGLRFNHAVDNATLIEPILVSLVHRGGPGRIRVKIKGLYRSDPMKRALEKLSLTHSAFHSIDVNLLTGSALVKFEPDQPLAVIIDELESCARPHCQPSSTVIPEIGRKVNPSASPDPTTKSRRPPPSDSIKEPQHSSWKDRIFRPKPESPGASPQSKVKIIGETQVPPRQTWHALNHDEALQNLETGHDGLSSSMALTRLQHYGPNVLSIQKPRSALSMIVGQLMNPPVALLGLSAGISVATGGVADAVVILVVVIINAAIGYFTESEAEKIIGSLGTMTPTRAPVIRDGNRVEIPVEEVVPGDILTLEPGAYIPADGRLIASNRMTVDESALTGESLPVGKRHQFVAAEDTPLADRKNMVHRGTVVTGGSGMAVTVATGKHTEIGIIQSLVGEVKPPETPLQRQLDNMGTQLALLSGGICVAMFGLGLVRGFGWLQMLKSSISLAVAAVPEGLPAVATTTLALGIQRMQKQRVLVRQLPAVEGLGSIQTLCLDKTGTLTENRMKSVGIELVDCSITLNDGCFWANNQAIEPLQREDLKKLLEVVCLCSEVKFNGDADRPELEGSPTETALIDIALDAGRDIRALREQYPVLKTIHRAEDRPYMVTVHQNQDQPHLVAIKGSPGEVLALCTRRLTAEGTDVNLDELQQNMILARNERMAGQALRVLGVAIGFAEETATASVTQNLIWLGLVGMEDTIREGMDQLMAKFHDAGIETVMITGDQSATAFSVGKRLGLNHNKPLEIVDSTSLEKLDPEVLAGIVTDTTVFARVSPAHKLRIVQALQKAGRVVAMTGDGINDGPALKAADVGVALGNRGTEVARSVADVVLEDDNLHTMIAAVEQGRTIYANIRKSLRFLLASNLSEIEIMLIGTAIGAGEVLNPIQLLWINLLTDILPGLGLALEPPEHNVLKQPPRDPSEAIVRKKDAIRMVRESILMTGGVMGVYGYSLMRYGLGPAAAGNAFMTVTLSQLLHSISCRSEHTSIFRPGGRQTNPFLNYALIGSGLLQVIAAYFPPLRTLLRLGPIAPVDWLTIASGATLPFLLNEGIKLLETHPHQVEGKS
jgi:Ca2+-transporting ATPase